MRVPGKEIRSIDGGVSRIVNCAHVAGARLGWVVDGAVDMIVKGSAPTLVPSGIPHEAMSLFLRLLGEPLRRFDDLRARVRAHAERIRLAMGTNEFVDAAVGLSLADVALALLDEAQSRGGEELNRIVQAAVLYFVMDDDADHDLHSVCGLDDDAAVLNAVARQIGREDLVVQI